MIGVAGATRLFTVTDFLDTDYVELLRGAEGAEALQETIVLRGTVPAGCVSWKEFVGRGHEVDRSESLARGEAVQPDDLCDILFTSGTTGRPKGAMLMHAASIRAYDAWSTVVGLREGDRYLIVNPFFHAFGLKAGILACLVKGATIIPHAVFDVPSVMRRVVEERMSMLPGPPAIFQTILNHPDLDDFDFSSLRLSVTGAAAIPTQMIIDMREKLGFENVVTGYGLTESHGIAAMCRHDDPPRSSRRRPGGAIPDVEVIVADARRRRAADGGAGRGARPWLQPHEAASSTTPTRPAEAIDADGWLHTGDIAYKDEGGNLVITDRLKDMFIVGGFNAYPAEIENILMGRRRHRVGRGRRRARRAAR